jgi:drug/metabolite transporter (DMT)-like permease
MKNKNAIGYAFLAAVLFGINAPFSKILVNEIHPLFLASLLYLGAGIGMTGIFCIRYYKKKPNKEAKLTKDEMPDIILMVILDIIAPVFLLFGIRLTNSSTVALLGNFEIVATSIIAMLLFSESIGKRLWVAIGLISVASIILTTVNMGELNLSVGAILVLLACICWGFENNCTRKLSLKDPLQIVMIKGLGSGFGALIIAFVCGEIAGSWIEILSAMGLGFVAFGLSIFYYVKAQRELGAARTSAYYAIAPFVGVMISWIIFKDGITVSFLLALIIMIIGAYLAASEKHLHKHCHEYEKHEHLHSHDDLHHSHHEGIEIIGEHCHSHCHERVEHRHAHMPDIHHRHQHK